MMMGGRIRFLRLFVGVAFGVMTPSAAWASFTPIHLEFRPAESSVRVHDPVALGLWAFTSPGETQLFRALDMVFTWEPDFLQFEGLDSTGAVPLLSSGLPEADPHGLNEVVPPRDGDGYYKAWAPLGAPISVTSAGVLLTTFVFTALLPNAETIVSPASSGGQPLLETTVWGGPDANTIVTGTLGRARIEIIPEPLSAIMLLLGGMIVSRRRD